MRGDDQAQFLGALALVRRDLVRLMQSSESDTQLVAQAFKGLAAQADAILKQAAAIVGCVENENVATVLVKVQALCRTVKSFLQQRLEAASAILDMLKEEERLLRQLTRVRHRQEAVAAHLKSLSVLTNVEVAQLRDRGGDFELLARELSLFSKSVFEQTHELANHTQNCEHTIAETSRELAASLPQLRQEMTRMEADIAQALQAIEADLTQLANVPGQFRAAAAQTSEQISGVISAIQAQDITRQQTEHVQQALDLIELKMGKSNPSDVDLGLAHAGLTIQTCQLQNIKQTVESWTSQIGRCMAGIHQLSVSDLVGLGPVVLNQERELSSQLAHVDLLQQRSQEYSARIQKTLAGLSSLLQLVNDHLARSHTIRHLLRLLTFNSLVEAHRLGELGRVVSAIANLIKVVSLEWNEIADQSANALNEILNLVTETNKVMEVFSERSMQKMREDQGETRTALNAVREAAAFVGREAAQMQTITRRMQSDLAGLGKPAECLDRSFAGLGSILDQIDSLARQLRSSEPQIAARYDPAEVEHIFSASYTTEIERMVMQAAMQGTPLPGSEQSLAGNAVELF